jgi:hypothetical protein
MRRYPSHTWEYGPTTREILAARDLTACLEQDMAMEEFAKVALSLLPNDPEEVSGKSGEEEVAREGGSATASPE